MHVNDTKNHTRKYWRIQSSQTSIKGTKLCISLTQTITYIIYTRKATARATRVAVLLWTEKSVTRLTTTVDNKYRDHFFFFTPAGWVWLLKLFKQVPYYHIINKTAYQSLSITYRTNYSCHSTILRKITCTANNSTQYIL